MRCFVAPRDLVERHECELMGEQPDGCRFQEVLRAEKRRLVFLPGLATPLGIVEMPSDHYEQGLEAELPPHEGAGGAMQRLEQAYDLGDDVLLTCLSCGGHGAGDARRPHPLLRASSGGHRLLVRAPLPGVRRASLQGRLPVPLPSMTEV